VRMMFQKFVCAGYGCCRPVTVGTNCCKPLACAYAVCCLYRQKRDDGIRKYMGLLYTIAVLWKATCQAPADERRAEMDGACFWIASIDVSHDFHKLMMIC